MVVGKVKTRRMKARPKIIWISVGIVFLLMIVFIIFGLSIPLTVSEVKVASELIEHPVRIALISDLHSCKYAERQTELIDAISGQNPDLVCLVGDIFDDKLSDENAELFLAGISEKYPCYYVTGNHECWAGTQAFQKKMAILDRYGIVRLQNENKEIELYGQKLNICGIDDPDYDFYDNQYQITDALYDVKSNLPNSNYTILLSHRPEYYSYYTSNGFDLVLCGHAHGGQWRIPGILENGLFAPDQGLFPKYTNGKYTYEKTTMIVSRGLAKESTRVPRFYNKPEIVIIEIQ